MENKTSKNIYDEMLKNKTLRTIENMDLYYDLVEKETMSKGCFKYFKIRRDYKFFSHIYNIKDE